MRCGLPSPTCRILTQELIIVHAGDTLAVDIVVILVFGKADREEKSDEKPELNLVRFEVRSQPVDATQAFNLARCRLSPTLRQMARPGYLAFDDVRWS